MNLHYPTGNILCNALGEDAAYSWLAITNDVHIVNESWGCDAITNAPTLEGQVQDWWARFADVTITKAGGYTIQEALSACEFTLNSICVGAVDEFDGFNGIFEYGNPAGSDREDPDVVARGDGVVADGLTASTGYSAPVGYGISTSTGYGGDMFDGAGRISAHSARIFCDPGDTVHVPNAPTTSDFGSSTLVPGSGESTPGEGPPLEEDEFEEPNQEGWYLDTLGLGSAREYHQLWEATLEAGDRVRFTFVYDACPAMAGGGGSAPGATAPASVAMDIDVGIINIDSGVWEFASQSFDDNVEGFDVVVQDTGTYRIYAMNDPMATPCAGAAAEDYGWALNVWQQVP